ncbi:substrate-binding domain-containing protein, partial [Streptomyces anulatus]|uniref:substrate-binding domain-containing protein n=1 Tax=Streptomyces anulatus TaxID=1892 RepID=UPI003650D65D
RWEYGLPARAEAELAWVQHALAHLREGGTAVLLMPPAAAARHMHPALTSVRQPIEEMGRRMTQLLLDEIAGRAPGDERPSVVLPTELVVRDSS